MCLRFGDYFDRELAASNLSTIDLRNHPNISYNSVDALRESLADALAQDEPANQAAFRYTLLLDPTDSQLSVQLLFDLGLVDPAKAVVRTVSDFSSDNTAIGLCFHFFLFSVLSLAS